VRLIDVDELLKAYDVIHVGPPGGARKLMVDAPTIDAIPVEWLQRYSPEKWSTYMQAAVEIIIDDWKKEQEAFEPTIANAENHDGHTSHWYQCGACMFPIDKGDRYCRHCGRPVKWE